MALRVGWLEQLQETGRKCVSINTDSISLLEDVSKIDQIPWNLLTFLKKALHSFSL